MFDFLLWLCIWRMSLSVTYPNLLLPALIIYLSNDVDIFPYFWLLTHHYSDRFLFFGLDWNHHSPLLHNIWCNKVRTRVSFIKKKWLLFRTSHFRVTKNKSWMKTGNFFQHFPIFFLYIIYLIRKHQNKYKQIIIITS